MIGNRTDACEAWEHWIEHDPLLGLAFRVTAIENPLPFVANGNVDGIVLVLTEYSGEALRLVEQIRDVAGDAALLVSIHRAADFESRFFVAGADRLVEPWDPKDVALRDLRQALASRASQRTPTETEPVLPPKLAEVRRLIGERRTDSEIAELLGIGLGTVKGYGRQVRETLGVAKRRQVLPLRA